MQQTVDITTTGKISQPIMLNGHAPCYYARCTHPQLSRFVDYNIQVQGMGRTLDKDIQPRPGASLIFDVNGILFNDKFFANNALAGIHEQAYNIKPQTPEADCFTVKLSAYGLSRFTPLPAHTFANHIVDASAALGDSITDLYDAMSRVKGFEDRIALAEAYFADHLLPTSGTDEYIWRIADRIYEEDGNSYFDAIRAMAPMSMRQLERRFRSIIGVGIRSYMRICRFSKANELLIVQPHTALTHVGYEAGYYDQAHFSRHFKDVTHVAPKDYIPCAPTMKERS